MTKDSFLELHSVVCPNLTQLCRMLSVEVKVDRLLLWLIVQHSQFDRTPQHCCSTDSSKRWFEIFSVNLFRNIFRSGVNAYFDIERIAELLLVVMSASCCSYYIRSHYSLKVVSTH